MAKKTETTTAVAKKEAPGAMAVKEEHKALLEEDGIDSQDLMLSKILAMQGLSSLVASEKARMGELRDHITAKLLAKKGEKLECILFKPFKTWTIFENINGKEEFKAIIPFTSENMHWDREAMEGKTKITRYQTLNYYTLMPSEIKEGDHRPRVLSFRSTNYKTGRKIETTRAFLKKMNLALPFKVMNIWTELTENEKGKWYRFDCEEGRKSTEGELDAVKEWIGLIDTSNVVVDNSDLERGEENSSGGAPESRATGEVREDDDF